MTTSQRRHGWLRANFYRAALALLLASTAANAADLQRGVVKYQAGDYDGALSEWRPLAEKNDPNALFNIGQAYRLGRGVKEDMATALQFYQRAGTLGHVAAQGNAGTLLYFGTPPLQDKVAAVDWWQRASANGDPRSQYMMGVLSFNGEGVPKDWPWAYALTVQARDSGLPEAAKALEQMDKYLAETDKTAGRVLIAEMKAKSASGAPVAGRMDSAAVKPTARPDAAMATQPAAAPMIAATAPAPAKIAAPVKAAKATAAAAQVPAASPGSWRVQLGSFATEAAAQKAWTDMTARNTGLAGNTPAYTPTGAGGTRLQVGSFSGRDGADGLCAKLKLTNTPCFVVKVQ